MTKVSLYAAHFGKIHLIANVTILRVYDPPCPVQEIPIRLAKTQQRPYGFLTMVACGNSYILSPVDSSRSLDAAIFIFVSWTPVTGVMAAIFVQK